MNASTTTLSSTTEALDKIDGMMSQSAAWDANKMDVRAMMSEANFTDKSIVIPSDPDIQVGITNNALSHLCDKLGAATQSKSRLPYKYLAKDAPGGVYAHLLGAHAKDLKRVYTFRMHGTTLRAVVAADYPRFGIGSEFGDLYENTFMLKSLRDVIATLPYSEVDTVIFDADEIVMRIGLKELDVETKTTFDAVGWETGSEQVRSMHWIAGIGIANSEAARRSFKVYPTFSRDNGRIKFSWDDSDWAITLPHAGSPMRFRNALTIAFQEAMRSSLTGAADALLRASKEEVPNMGAVLAEMCKNFGWSEETKVDLAMAVGSTPTRLALAEGVASLANTERMSDPEEKVKIAAIAGTILIPKKAKRVPGQMMIDLSATDEMSIEGEE